MAQTQTLREYAASKDASLRIDREKGIIHGVKLLGTESANGRTYPVPVIAKAQGLYEGAKVNVNHARSESEPRGYEDRIGFVSGVSVKPDGLYGDFHFNPKHVLSEQLLWDAENAPANVGFSHVIDCRATPQNDGRLLIEEIVEVESVDLVACPASTRGLYESRDSGGKSMGDEKKPTIKEVLEKHKENPKAAIMLKLIEQADMAATAAMPAETATDPNEEIKSAFKKAAMAILGKAFDGDMDLGEAMSKIKKLLGQADQAAPSDASAAPDATTESLKNELAALKADNAVRELLEAAGCKATPVQRKALLGLTEEADRKALIETWKGNGQQSGQRPESREQGAVSGTPQTTAVTEESRKSFVASIKE